MPLLTPAHPDWAKLFEPSAPVTDYETQVRPFVPEMRKLIERKRAIGGYAMSAAQIGVFYRFFIYGGKHFKTNVVHVVINPENVQHTGELMKDSEMCMSFPDRWKYDVLRWSKTTFDYTNVGGIKCKMVANGFLSRVMQHELDHLDGVCLFGKDEKDEKEEQEEQESETETSKI